MARLLPIELLSSFKERCPCRESQARLLAILFNVCIVIILNLAGLINWAEQLF